MTFEKACEKALSFLAKQFGDKGFDHIWDLGDSWLFSGDDGSKLARYGPNPVRVYKTNGSLELFLLSNPANWESIDRGTKINIPEKYVVTNG